MCRANAHNARITTIRAPAVGEEMILDQGAGVGAGEALLVVAGRVDLGWRGIGPRLGGMGRIPREREDKGTTPML